MGRRDEALTGFLIRIAMQFVINLTYGMIMAVIIFMWEVWSLLVLYKTSLLSAALFFGVATVGAIAVSFSYIMLV